MSTILGDVRTRKWLLPVLTLLCLIPSLVLADGVSPVLNLFHKDTWRPAVIVTALIILIESALLRLQIQQVPYFNTLWRCTLLNLASSLVGSVLLVGLGRDSFFVWDGMSLVLPLFLITVVTEIPLLRLLYGKLPLSWGRACALGFGMNVASYVAVFVAEFVFAIGYLAFAGHLDEKERSEWIHPELLTQSAGQIYATEPAPAGSHRLRVLDTRTANWQSLTNCPALDPNTWDVEGRTCAFVREGSKNSDRETVVIASLPDFSVLCEISLSALVDPQYDRATNRQGIVDLSLSPDARKVAVLFHVTDAVAYRDRSSYFDLGGKCALAVFDVNSGRQVVRASRWASDRGMCWFPDSSAVLFTSFRDEGVYQTAKSAVRGSTSFGVGYAKGDRYPRGLFSFHITTGEVRWFAEGESPTVSVATRQFVVRDDDQVRIVDTRGTSRVCAGIARLSHSRAVLSPCGKLILAQLWRHQPLSAGSRLTVIDIGRPSLRHLLASDLGYRFKWTATGQERSARDALPK